MRRLLDRITEGYAIVQNDRRGAGYWRAGCSTCGWRRDYISHEYAERGLRGHLEERGLEANSCDTDVYPPTWKARFYDWSLDHRGWFEGD